jgi:C-terminal processing protease CtpA/Prc
VLPPPRRATEALVAEGEAEECGVGMELVCDDDCVWYVAAVRPGGPAAACGVVGGDMLRAVDWMHVKVRSRLHAAAHARGIRRARFRVSMRAMQG